MGLLTDCKGEASVLSGEAGLEGVFEGKVLERKMTTGLLGKSKPEDVKCWKSSSGSEKTERQSSQTEKVECSVA